MHVDPSVPAHDPSHTHHSISISLFTKYACGNGSVGEEQWIGKALNVFQNKLANFFPVPFSCSLWTQIPKADFGPFCLGGKNYVLPVLLLNDILK